MSYSRFRFAKIKNHKVDDNFLERLGEGMLKFGVQNIEPRRFGFRVVKKEKDHLWARFVKERIRKDPVLTRTNDESKESHRVAHFKYVFIFPNGLIAYETLRITKSDIFEAIVASWQKVKKSNESDIEIITKDEFEPKLLKEFYNESKMVNYISVKEIGKKPPNPHPPKKFYKEITTDIGADAERLDIKAKSRRKGNLKDINLLEEGIIPLSQIEKINAIDEENFAFEIDRKGVVSSFTPDNNEDKKREKILKLIKRAINYLKD